MPNSPPILTQPPGRASGLASIDDVEAVLSKPNEDDIIVFNAYQHKERYKQLGCLFNKNTKAWYINKNDPNSKEVVATMAALTRLYLESRVEKGQDIVKKCKGKYNDNGVQKLE